MEKLKNRQNILRLFQFAAIALLVGRLCALLFDLGNITGDEWDYIENAKTNMPTFKDMLSAYSAGFPFLSRARTVSTWIFFPITYLQYCGGLLLYRVCNVAAILISVYFCCRFVKRLLNTDSAIMFALLFLGLLQIYDTNYTGFTSYGMGYQLSTSFIFISLEMFLLYFEKGKQRYLWFTGVFYFIACTSYECRVFICVAMLFIAIAKLKEQNKLNFMNLVKALAVPALFGFLYLVLYYVCSKVATLEYSGISVSETINLKDFLLTVETLTFSSFPLRLSLVNGAFVLKAVPKAVIELSFANFFRIVSAVFVGVASVKTLYSIALRNTVKWWLYVVGFILTAVFVAVPQAVTPKYIDHVMTGYLKSAGISYTPYFFLITIVVLFLAVLTAKKGKVVKIILVVLISAACYITFFSNDYYKSEANKRYYSIERVFESEYFSEKVYEGATIYISGFRGFHADTEYIEDLILKETGYNTNAEVFNEDMVAQPLKEEGSLFVRHYWNTGSVLFYQMDGEGNAKEVFLLLTDEYYYPEKNMTVYYGEDFLLAERFGLSEKFKTPNTREIAISTEKGYVGIRLNTTVSFNFRAAGSI